MVITCTVTIPIADPPSSTELNEMILYNDSLQP